MSGLAPFFLRNLRPLQLAALPWLSKFLELNVRTHVKDVAGVTGIWFYSLGFNQPLGVLGGAEVRGDLLRSSMCRTRKWIRRWATDSNAQAASSMPSTFKFTLQKEFDDFLATLARLSIKNRA
jgi:uncharacterized protein YqjF (DUF2071 family)